MSPRKYALLLIGALLLVALMIVYFTRSSDWNWSQTDAIDGQIPAPQMDGRSNPKSITDIYVTVSVPSSHYNSLLQSNGMFMDKYPHLRVHLHNELNGFDTYAEWMELSARGNAADIMLLDNSWVMPFAVQGYLKPVDSLMTGDFLSDQLTGLIDPLRWNGYLWGVPKGLSPYVMLWNADMLRELGLDEPPNEWSEFHEAAERLKEASNEEERFIANFSPGDLHQLMQWNAKFDTENAALLQLLSMDAGQSDKAMWLQSEPERVAWLSMAQSSRLSELVADDRLLSLILSWSDYQRLTETARGKLIIDKEAIKYPWLNGSSFVIGAGSKVESDAMLWIQEISDPSNQQFAYEQNGILPTRASLYAEQTRLLNSAQHMPPIWWLEILTAKGAEEPLPDPQWPLRWQGWLNQWEAYTATAEAH